MEDRRSKWTTYSNLNLWFDRWKLDLIELGFGTEDRDGSLLIPEDQLTQIFNIDETGLSLNVRFPHKLFTIELSNQSRVK